MSTPSPQCFYGFGKTFGTREQGLGLDNIKISTNDLDSLVQYLLILSGTPSNYNEGCKLNYH